MPTPTRTKSYILRKPKGLQTLVHRKRVLLLSALEAFHKTTGYRFNWLNSESSKLIRYLAENDDAYAKLKAAVKAEKDFEKAKQVVKENERNT